MLKIEFIEFGGNEGFELFTDPFYQLSSKIWHNSDSYDKIMNINVNGFFKTEYLESEWGLACYLTIQKEDYPCTLILKGDMFFTDASDKTTWFLHDECYKLLMMRENRVKRIGL